MYIARILYPVKVLGPGYRIGIWFDGCPRRCKGCSNPELWEFDERYRTSLDVVKTLISKICSTSPVDGFTITGGEPLYQREAFCELMDYLSSISRDILVYTGYRWKEIEPALLEKVAVLVDGEYVEELNSNVFLRGSSNQKIHILSDELKEKYEKYLSDGTNQIQNFSTCDGVISVGIHKPGFEF